MSGDPQQVQRELAVRREHTDEAFQIDEPVHNPRVGPRVIPVIVAIAAVLVIIGLFSVAPRA